MTPTQLEVAVRNAEAYSRDVCGFGRPNMKFIHVSHTWRAGGIWCGGFRIHGECSHHLCF